MSSSITTNKPSKPAKTSLPKPPTHLDPTCLISDTAILTGTHLITIGPDTILHPRSRIISNYGPVTLGRGCIISEKCVVGYSSPGPSDGTQQAEMIFLNEDVVLEPGSHVESSIGMGTCVEAGARVDKGAVVGEHCKITPLCVLKDGEVLGDFEVLFGDGQRRKQRPGLEKARKIVHDKEVAVLKTLIKGDLAKWQ